MTPIRQLLELALRHYRAGEWRRAEQLCGQVLEGDREQVDALQILAVIAGQTGRHDEAIRYLRTVLQIQPQSADAHNNLANVLRIADAPAEPAKLDEAIAHYRAAVRLRPDFFEARNNLGIALLTQGQLNDAEVQLRRTLAIQPSNAHVHCNLGIVLWKQRRLDEAAACYERALELQPGNTDAHVNLGNILNDCGRIDDALAALRAALRLKPDAADIHSNLICLLRDHPRYDSRAIYEECTRWYRQHAEPLERFIGLHSNRPDPDRRLRVGYVSPDFREHACSSFTVPLLANHDRRALEVYGYSDVERPDDVTERLRGHADVWKTTVGLPDQQLADMIRSDRIDILVDLVMHTAKNRLLAFARKPAPVQVSWLAYPGTTGLRTIEYRLTDPYLDPPGLFDAFHCEESVRLPETFWCYDPLIDQPAVNALPAATRGALTFGCLCNFHKVNDVCLRLWSLVLTRLPRSRLLLVAPLEPRERVLSILEACGIARERVEFAADRRPRLEYFKLYHRIDVALDTLPCNGATTTLDAFSMGVPTVSLIGQTVVGRAGFSLLSNLGLKELSAETPEQFVEIAAGLAGDTTRLHDLRQALRQRLQASPLMDGERFARNVEDAYRWMWQTWCRQAR
jgi:predicted O-linked N-acetylglucosamine transferase (SPINDLY family)